MWGGAPLPLRPLRPIDRDLRHADTAVFPALRTAGSAEEGCYKGGGGRQSGFAASREAAVRLGAVLRAAAAGDEPALLRMVRPQAAAGYEYDVAEYGMECGAEGPAGEAAGAAGGVARADGVEGAEGAEG